MRSTASGDFIEVIARGLDVIRCFDAAHPVMPVSQVAAFTGLPRPTVRRILVTLEELGYVRDTDAGFALTTRVLDLGMAYIGLIDVWELLRPHLAALVAQTNESSSIAMLEGSDVVYVARVAVPKLIALRVEIGTRFPAVQTSLGKVILAGLDPGDLDRVLAVPSRSGLTPPWQPGRAEIDAVLAETRDRGWAMTDQQLSHSIRSIAAPIRDVDGRVVAAVNINTHAGETSIDTLLEAHLPRLVAAAEAISRDWAGLQRRPLITA